MGLNVKTVERVTRECVLEVTPAEVLELLKRCKEVPRWAADRFQVSGGLVTVRWVEDVEPTVSVPPGPEGAEVLREAAEAYVPNGEPRDADVPG